MIPGAIVFLLGCHLLTVLLRITLPVVAGVRMWWWKRTIKQRLMSIDPRAPSGRFVTGPNNTNELSSPGVGLALMALPLGGASASDSDSVHCDPSGPSTGIDDFTSPELCNRRPCDTALPPEDPEGSFSPLGTVADVQCRTAKQLSQRRYYLSHRDALTEKARVWWELHPERRKRKDPLYIACYTKCNRKKKHEYYIKNRATIIASHSIWSRNNRAKCARNQRAYLASNPQARARHAEVEARRRAQKLNGREIEVFSHLEIAQRDNWRCHMCGRKVTQRTWSIDHLIPLSKGGNHTRRNVALAHFKCNASRGNRGKAQLLLIG
jgi:5-methylcytosine-specific restriction endonuclease McrA